MTWKDISEGLRYFFVGVMGLINATDLISKDQIKIYTLLLSIIILALKAVDIMTKTDTTK